MTESPRCPMCMELIGMGDYVWLRADYESREQDPSSGYINYESDYQECHMLHRDCWRDMSAWVKEPSL